LGLAGILALAGAQAPEATAQEEAKKVLIYSGTTGYRHEGGGQAIGDAAVQAIQSRLADAGIESDYRTCNGMSEDAGDPPGCRNPEEGNPAIFTPENLAQYDAIFLFNASDYWSGTGGEPGQLWNAEEEQAIIEFVQNGGGIAANHNATDMGAGQPTWDWWDGSPDSVVGTTMPGHASNGETGTVITQDHHHISTRDLPDTWEVTDEHYNWERNVRGTHHVLANFDERTYNTGPNGMGQDHPISWCKSYDGEAVEDGTGEPKPYNDGRTWITGIGHNTAVYTENDGDNPFMDHLIGGIRWVAGEGKKSDCGGTVWSNFSRTVIVSDANGPIGLDVAADGKVYWTEIGSQGPWPNYESEGYIKMHDPEGEPGNVTTVATIPTRADHGNSEDGVLGMTLEPGFDLSDPEKRDIYVYYSPRNPDWPTEGDEIEVGWNVVSRFTLNEDGTEVLPDSEREILRVDKAKISGAPFGDAGPGHVGGAGLRFDSEGNLYLGVGDDVSPNAPGHDRYAPMDHRRPERWDARKTSANTGDLRGKILRIKPLEEIPEGAEPGLGETYEVPEGNMFEPGTPNARPEIYAMGFRQPFTVHTDPANPGTVTVGEFCHDNATNNPERSPAGVCEWNLLDGPGFHGWPFCVGDNSPANTMFRWDYTNDESTGDQYDCSLDSLPADLRYDPPGGGDDSSEPTNEGMDEIPGPAVPATIWKKYPGAEGGPDPLDFGDLSAGGMQPITGPIYRYDPENAKPGAFPPYYDGSWFIHNRGGDNGFWKEVRLAKSDNEMLHVHDFIPSNHFDPEIGQIIPSTFGPDGALYMARYQVGCCRNQTDPTQQTQIVKIEFNVADDDGEEPGGEAQLKAAVKPKRKTVNKRAKKVAFRFRVRNAGDAESPPLKVCATAPKRALRIIGPKALKGKGKRRCLTANPLDAGKAKNWRFTFKPKPKARGKKVKIKFTAGGKGVANAKAQATLKVRR
jgi:hypothetical protein